MLNNISLMGRLTRAPELRHTQSGVPVASFALAVERNYSAGERRETDFFDCVAWRGTAEFIAKWFAKGQLIAVEGSLQTRTYEDRDGNNRKVVEVLAERAHFAESKRREGDIPGNAADPGGLTELDDGGDEELPF